MWVTAGHVIQRIDELFQNRKCDVRCTAWIDNKNDNYESKHNVIYFDYSTIKKKFFIYNNTMDLGVIRLEGNCLERIGSNPSNKWLTVSIPHSLNSCNWRV